MLVSSITLIWKSESVLSYKNCWESLLQNITFDILIHVNLNMMGYVWSVPPKKNNKTLVNHFNNIQQSENYWKIERVLVFFNKVNNLTRNLTNATICFILHSTNNTEYQFCVWNKFQSKWSKTLTSSVVKGSRMQFFLHISVSQRVGLHDLKIKH